MAKPGIDELLIASALQPELRQRLRESPEEAFAEFDLTEEEKDILRRPDHRLLRLLGEALGRQSGSSAPIRQARTFEPRAYAAIEARTLPDMAVAVTVVPCAQYENGQLTRFAYAIWVNSLPDGADTASLPPPAGAILPGEPLPELRAVLQLSAVQLVDADGKPQVGLWAALKRSSNITATPRMESKSETAAVQAAVEAVRGASKEDRYDRIADLLQVLRVEEAS